MKIDYTISIEVDEESLQRVNLSIPYTDCNLCECGLEKGDLVYQANRTTNKSLVTVCTWHIDGDK